MEEKQKSKPEQPASHHTGSAHPWRLKDHHRLLIAGGIILVVGGAVSWWMIAALAHTVTTPLLAVANQETPQGISETAPAPVVAPVQWYRRLDGMPVADEASANQWPIGVMIENLLSTRPQSGLSGAVLVYETLAESGVTRFLALYNGDGGKLEKIGPVRSARHYYVDWVLETAALYAHAGGSPQALGAIVGLGVNDLNGIGREARYFWRDRGLAAPHNLFTKSELLLFALRDKGFLEKQAAYDPWTFIDELPLEGRGSDDQKALLKFSSSSYDVEWRYRREGNVYTRFNAGQPHTDRETGAELTAKNIVIQKVKAPESLGEKGRIDIETTGDGAAIILHDGKVFEGRWQKADRAARTLFTDAAGAPLTLARGTTWVEVIPEESTVTLPL